MNMDFGTAENRLTPFIGSRCACEVIVTAGNYCATSLTLSVTGNII